MNIKNTHRVMVALAGLLVLGSGLTAPLAATAAEDSSLFRLGDAHQQRQQDRNDASDSLRNDRFSARLELDREQYGPNRAVEIRVAVENISRRQISISLGRNEPTLRVVIRDRNGRVVREFEQGNGLRLDSKERRSFRQLWDQRDERGRSVPAGVYNIAARLSGVGALDTQIYLTGDDRDGRPGVPGDLNPGRDNWNNGRPPRPGDADRNFRTDLSADTREIRPGKQIRFTYTVQNTGRDTQLLRFSSGRQFEVSVQNGNGQTLWQSSRGSSFIQAFTELRLSPGEKRTFTATWDTPRELRRDGSNYEVIAFLTPAGSSSNQVAPARLRLRAYD